MTGSDNAEQSAFWNTQPGRNWVENQADLDAIHADINDVLVAACAPVAGEAVLDVGSGAGATSLTLARAVAPGGHVLGIDISKPLVQRARERAVAVGLENVAFEVADAQDHRFAEAGFDLVTSRFGVMFFADPVAAFANIAAAMRPGGRMVFVAWSGPERNPWFAWPQRIAAARLGDVAPAPPGAPGPMAFRDTDRVEGILRDAGLSRCAGEFLKVDLTHPGGVDAVVQLLSRVGPVARLMREKAASAEDAAAIVEAVAAEFRQFDGPDGCRIPAGINLFTAMRA
jgi:SAM-dependent methyltransferase